MKHPSDGDWGRYNTAHADRGPRELTRLALAAAGEGHGRTAVELGSGAGNDAGFLEEHRWRVRSFDADPGSRGGSVHRVVDLVDLRELPRAELILANATLSFLPRDVLDRIVTLSMAGLEPGGVLAADFWGPHDDWASGPGSYPDRAELEQLFRDCLSVDIDESEWDGSSFGGDKHWHVLTVLARR